MQLSHTASSNAALCSPVMLAPRSGAKPGHWQRVLSRHRNCDTLCAIWLPTAACKHTMV